jgi:hypothetical protein
VREICRAVICRGEPERRSSSQKHEGEIRDIDMTYTLRDRGGV